MRFRRKSLIFCATFMIGLAAAVLSVGSLVNFHQYKIWGKPLLQEMIGYKRDNESAVKSIEIGSSSDNISGFTPGFYLLPSGNNAGYQLFHLTGFLLNPDTGHPAVSSILCPFPALRAPPQS